MEKKKGVPRSRGTLIHGLEIALLAIHHFRSFCRIRRLNPLPALCTLPAPQFAGVTKRVAILMSLCRASMRNRDPRLSVELQFLRNDFVGLAGSCTEEDFLAEIIGNISDGIGDVCDGS